MTTLAIAAFLVLSQSAVDGGVATAPVSSPNANPDDKDEGISGVRVPNPKRDAPDVDSPNDQARAPENMPSPAGANPPTAILGEWWKKLRPFGYVKAGVFYTFPFTNEQLVGSNGGFRIATARIGMEFALVEQLQVVASIELGAPQLRPDDPLQGGRIVEMRDAYVEYRPFRFLWFRIGQFKAPFNGETLLGDADLPFVTRSVVTDGVNPPEAFGRDGLTLGRQVGLQVSSDRLGGDAFGFRYYLAAVNGNGQNQLFNDSNPVAPVGRIELDVFRTVSLGINGFYNVRTEGIRPNRLNVNQIGYGADLAVRVAGFRALAGFLGRNNTYSTGILPPDMSMGFFGQLQYVLERIGLEGAVRFAWLDPSSAQTADSVWDIAALIGYRFKVVPLRVILQYTHREEERAVAIQNESLDFMVQATW